MTAKLIGREIEQRKIISLFESDEAEFLALYGRRRVGKTFLVRETFKDLDCIYFEVTGQRKTPLKKQLENFVESFQKVFYPSLKIKPPRTWKAAFQMITKIFTEIDIQKKVVVFLDELPWLAAKKSGLLSALDYEWNTEWVKNPKFKLIVCGSAASWMIKNIISDKGGLHNRTTDRFPLHPFTLKESETYLNSRGINLSQEQILQIYMVMGGIPYYLRAIKKGKSAIQNINEICFQKSALLYDEFDNLFKSLFSYAEIYEEIIKIIASKRYGVEQKEILNKSKLSSAGGAFTRRLKELEEAGFIKAFKSVGKKKKGKYYRLIDEYSVFYLSWILPVKGQLLFEEPNNYWEQQAQTTSWKSWAGYTFETICFKHLSSITAALGISHLAKTAYPWRYVPGEDETALSGAQIDLVIERSDDSITLCEMKYNEKEMSINKSMAMNLVNKLNVYKEVSKTKKHIFIAMVTCAGIVKNQYSAEYIANSVILADFFNENL